MQQNIVFRCNDCTASKRKAVNETFEMKSEFKVLTSTIEERLTKVTADIEEKVEKIIAAKLAESVSVQKALDQSASTQRETTAKLEEVASKIGNLGASYAQIVQSSPKDNSASDKTFLRSIVRESIHEKHREEQRKYNVIVFGFPERATEKEDNDTFIALCATELNVCLKNVTKSRRLGLKTVEKHRPLLVTLQTSMETRLILASAKSLRNSSAEDIKQIYIAADMSKEERERQKLFREERRARSEKQDKNVTTKESDPKNSEAT